MAVREGLRALRACPSDHRHFVPMLSRSKAARLEPEGSHPSLAILQSHPCIILSLDIKKPAGAGFKQTNGGEGGIRTLDTGLGYTPLAGERLQPLGHLTFSADGMLPYLR